MPAPAHAVADATTIQVPREATARHLHVVLNARSGQQEADARMQRIREMAAQAGSHVEITCIRDPRRLVQAVRGAVAWAQQRGEPAAVVAAGGDGTINAVASQALEAGVPMGVLPLGTFNYFARSHGIPTDTEPALHALLHGRVKPVQVGMVNGRCFLVNASLGLYPELLEDREAVKRRLGRSRVSAALAALWTLLGRHPNWVIGIDGGDAGEETIVTSTLFVGNNTLQLEEVGLPEARALHRGRLAAVALKPMGRMAMLRLAWQAAAGRLNEAPDVLRMSFTEMTVSPRLPHRSRLLKVATDGETAWCKAPLRFEVAPKPLYLLVP